MNINITELAKLLPYPIRDKLRYYLNYIQDRLIDIALEEGKYHIIKDIKEKQDKDNKTFFNFIELLVDEVPNLKNMKLQIDNIRSFFRESV